MYQRVGKSAFKKDLSNTIALLEAAGNPHKKFKSIHIAGTNGKGTSAHGIAAILQKAGYKVGLYTSPHLKRFTERIKISGKEILQKNVVDFVAEYKHDIERINPSFFETTVAMAFDYFAKEEVDIAVIETGLGGRLDSTNVLTPEICLITTIGLEHTDLLGDTLDKIAFEKAGIIKPKVPVVVGDVSEVPFRVISEIAERNGSKLIKARAVNTDVDLSELPPYFELNLPGIYAVVNELKSRGWDIPEDSFEKGIAKFQSLTGLMGRFQTIQMSPKVIADVSHNQDGLTVLFEALEKSNYNHLHIVFGSVSDKPLGPIFSILPQDAEYYFTESSVPRKLPVDDLVNEAKNFGLSGSKHANVNDAKKAALENAAADDLILITGSTFIVAELEEL